MTNAERESRLAVLAIRGRVWGAAGGPEDKTPGLIELGRAWIRPESHVAEIGCFAGVSTSILACFARSVVAVDPWTLATNYGEVPWDMMVRAEAEFLRVCREYPHIRRVQGFSVAVAAGVPDGSLDLVYIDGAHSREAFVADVLAWRPKLKPGGVLAGHDYGLVSGYFGEAGLAPPRATYSESSWVV